MTHKMASGEDFEVVTKDGGTVTVPSSATDKTLATTDAVEALASALALKADAADLRYAVRAVEPALSTTTALEDTAAVAIQDRTVNVVALPGSVTAVTLALPAAAAGRARDFLVNLRVDGSTALTVTLTDPYCDAMSVDFGSDALAGVADGANFLTLTECAAPTTEDGATTSHWAVAVFGRIGGGTPSGSSAVYTLNDDGTVSTEGTPDADGTLSVEGTPNADGTLSVEVAV